MNKLIFNSIPAFLIASFISFISFWGVIGVSILIDNCPYISPENLTSSTRNYHCDVPFIKSPEGIISIVVPTVIFIIVFLLVHKMLR